MCGWTSNLTTLLSEIWTRIQHGVVQSRVSSRWHPRTVTGSLSASFVWLLGNILHPSDRSCSDLAPCVLQASQSEADIRSEERKGTQGARSRKYIWTRWERAYCWSLVLANGSAYYGRFRTLLLCYDVFYSAILDVYVCTYDVIYSWTVARVGRSDDPHCCPMLHLMHPTRKQVDQR